MTKTTESAYATVEGQQLMLIDTPGFIDTQQIESDEQQGTGEVFEAQTEKFRRNIRQAYKEAEKEVGAFVLVYSLNVRWTLEITQMIQFLDGMSFPWDHCIVVLTHGDHAFPGMPEDERYKALKKAMTHESDQLPKQLKKLIKSSNNALIIESNRIDDDYYHSVMKKLLAGIDDIGRPYSNPQFLHSPEPIRRSTQYVYETILRDNHSMDTLEAKTRDLFNRFKSTGGKVATTQTEFIGYLKKVIEMLDSKVLTPLVTAAGGFGVAIFLAGIFATFFGVGYKPDTFEASTAVVAIGIGSMAGGVALAALPSVFKMLINRTEVQKAQKSYSRAKTAMDRLHNLYQEIMQTIREDYVGRDHPEVHSLLFAHLAGVHMHGAKDKGDKLRTIAENIANYHSFRKQAKEQSKERSRFNSDSIETIPNYALPVGFNLLAKRFDVAYTVGTTVQIVQLSEKSKKYYMRVLRDSCIATLENETLTIMTLCSVPKQ
jgi:hypothetical protein